MALIKLLRSQKIWFPIIKFTLLAVPLLIFTVSCGGQGPVTTPSTTPSPAPSEPPAAEPEPAPSQSPEPATTTGVSIDGTISQGEYAGMVTYDSYEIHWTSNEQFIYIGLKSETSGWVAIGIQPGSKMRDADIIIGFIEGGATTIYDEYSTGNFGPHAPDTELGGSDDILEYGGSEKEGYTIIEFKRALNTGDEYDNQLLPGNNKIIWAYGAGDNAELKHSTRGYGELDI